MKRPVGVTAIAILYFIGCVALILGGLLSDVFSPYVALPTGVVLAALSFGMFTLQKWARIGGLILAGLNVVGAVGFIIYLSSENSGAVAPALMRMFIPVFVNVMIFFYLRQLEVEQAFGLYDTGQPSTGPSLGK